MDQQQWDEVAAGRRKWDEWTDRMLSGLNETLMMESHTGPGDTVLDLGTGTGHPGIYCAQRLRDSGKVIGIDLSIEMLRSAREKAANLINISFVQCDATDLPFLDSAFHSVISRCCIMFVPDIQKSLREAHRVLKPGGFWSAVVWGDPQRNPLPLNVLRKHLKIDPPSENQPGQYRFWQPGVLSMNLSLSGLVPVSEKEVEFEECYASGEEFFSRFMESSIMASKVKAETGEVQQKIKEDLIAAAEARRSGEFVRIPRFARIITARKP